MGCHTWYKIPYITGKEEIKKIAQDAINEWKQKGQLEESRYKMYQYAIDEELICPACELATSPTDTQHEDPKEWILYAEVERPAIDEINEVHGTEYTRLYHLLKEHEIEIETWHDDVRIGGYPDWIIRSYEGLLEKIETGYIDEDGEHYSFYYADDNKEKALEKVKRFFQKYPDGIITFG